MKQFSQFIDPNIAEEAHNQKCLQLLRIQKVSAETLIRYHVLPLPALSRESNLAPYREFITAVAGTPLGSLPSLQTTLIQSQIAVDRNRSLRRANELFDHEDDIFKSAFRGQKTTKFLHSRVQASRHFWLAVGLRHRVNGLLQPSDYLQCLQSLNQRQANADADDRLAADAELVLSPLITPNSSVRNFSSHWSAISAAEVFASRSNFTSQPDHRGFLMRDIASKRPLAAMSQLVSYRHVAVCWSQTPFAVHEPTAEVFAAIRGGNPSMEMVWKHLEYLAKMSQKIDQTQMTGFLHDLHSTYSYLQDHIDDCKTAFNSRRSAELWLNILESPGQQAVLMEVKFSWSEIADLNSSILHDMGAVKAIKPSLMPYEKLLRALGCASITWPAATQPLSHTPHPTMAGVRDLRRKNQILFDITFRWEGEVELDGQNVWISEEIRAHRLILASISKKCARQWNGAWSNEEVITYGNDIMSYHTLSTMINYAYEEDIDWAEMKALPDDDSSARGEKLAMLMDLHGGADFWECLNLASGVEQKLIDSFKLCINFQNVKDICEQAVPLRAFKFEKMCRDFIVGNQAAVDRANPPKANAK